MSSSKICPLCLKANVPMNREHLPFKALYKSARTSQQNSAAIIKICVECNQEKSIWDQEFLAVYGHLLNLDQALKAQISLKKINTVSNLDLLVLIYSCTATKISESIIDAGGVPADIVSQWFLRCGKGIYYYFERKPFKGTAVQINPKVVDLNTKASKFDFSVRPEIQPKCHRINDSCVVGLMREEGKSPLINIFLINKETDRVFVVGGFFEENLSQRENLSSRQILPEDEKPLRYAEPRDIYDVSVRRDGYSYTGVKKAKKSID